MGPILGTGRLISPAHFQEQIAPTSVGKGQNKPNLYFAYGFVISNGWIVQNPSINGYSGAFGYNLSNGGDVELVQRTMAARKEYQKSLEALRLHYDKVNDLERKKWADAALAYNGLVIAWPELLKLSRVAAPETGDKQSELF